VGAVRHTAKSHIMKTKTMHKIIYITAFVMGGCIISDGSSKENYTKLPDEGKAIEVKAFKAIHADGVFNIYLTQGDKEGVVVKGYYPKDLRVRNAGDTLVIEDTASSHTGHISTKTDIYITLTNITSMEIASVGTTKCTDTLKLKNFDFQSEGVGAITLWLNADSVKGSEDGVGSMTLVGKSAYADISDNGVGSLDGNKFMVGVLHVNVNGVGAANVYAEKEIYIQSSGVGGVHYRGPAKVMQSDNDGIGGVKRGE
jgi:hypothetical protein